MTSPLHSALGRERQAAWLAQADAARRAENGLDLWFQCTEPAELLAWP